MLVQIFYLFFHYIVFFLLICVEDIYVHILSSFLDIYVYCKYLF